jgi:hypothetical protein
MSYLHDGEVKHLSWAELQAGERVGSESYLDYAFGQAGHPSGRGGWELFEDRPGITGEDYTVVEMISNGYSVWSVRDQQTLLRLAKQLDNDWWTIGLVLKRSPSACRKQHSRLFQDAR